ncbi:cyclic pyranopterin monophosphate synthase MoaC [uncultured Rubinisphaera sp.]|uniref:cyclic pyranopterin monophosphate synthase MoaC n=1 Tax=uncultured Rubinisphaera sp. TaxID=1678686 RepID=UPI0030DA1CD2
MNDFTHFDDTGASRMVDVSAKAVTQRIARAEGYVQMQPATLQRILERGFGKGDVFEVARLAGIMGTKRTADLIPLCHTLPLESTSVDIQAIEPDRVRIEACVAVTAKTGVEMEALTAVTVAALTIYDMCKSVDREMMISQVQLIEKQGGRSGHFLKEKTPG